MCPFVVWQEKKGLDILDHLLSFERGIENIKVDRLIASRVIPQVLFVFYLYINIKGALCGWLVGCLHKSSSRSTRTGEENN